MSENYPYPSKVILTQSKSRELRELLAGQQRELLRNDGGEAGGFESILNMFANQNIWQNIEDFTLLCEIFQNLALFLHKNFVKAYFPKLTEVVFKNFLCPFWWIHCQSFMDTLSDSCSNICGELSNRF